MVPSHKKKIKGWVYIMEEMRTPSLIKIGHSNDPLRRVQELEVGNPSNIRLLLTIEGTKDAEIALHNKFRAHRENREWYRNEGGLAKFLKGIRTLTDGHGIRDYAEIAKEEKLLADQARQEEMNKW